MGARVIEKDDALSILEVWLKTGYEGGRHQKRLDYLHDIVEKNNFK
jgi:ribose 5-phosphate isomerase B